MPTINFPNPETQSTYQHVYNGITQNWVWGASLTVNGLSGPSAWIAQGFSITAADEASFVAGNNGEIQYKSGDSFSANSEATVVTDSSVSPNSGFSGNFVNYSESVRNDNTGLLTTDTTRSLTFGNYNIYTMRDLKLNAGVTLTLNFNTPSDGQSMTLILGYTGGADSNIKIPENENIYWSGGPAGDSGGGTAIIDTETTDRKYDILYFFSDGTNLYGNFVSNYRKE
jgi:hypothetical protein